MVELFQMWALVEVLGIICLPLTITVFHNLPDRGWAFSKAIGIAVLAFGVWLPLMCASKVLELVFPPGVMPGERNMKASDDRAPEEESGRSV